MDRYRYELRAAITMQGYRSINKFAKDHRIDTARMSRIINGWEIPTPINVHLCCSHFGDRKVACL